MRLAIIDKVKDVLIEVPPETFRENLIAYTKKTKDVGEAFDLLCKEIRSKTKKI